MSFHEHFHRKFVTLMQQLRDELTAQVADLPDAATTQGQQALQAKHGTPRAFAQACIAAIGEIDVYEAQEAIEKYRAEWTAA